MLQAPWIQSVYSDATQHRPLWIDDGSCSGLFRNRSHLGSTLLIGLHCIFFQTVHTVQTAAPSRQREGGRRQHPSASPNSASIPRSLLLLLVGLLALNEVVAALSLSVSPSTPPHYVKSHLVSSHRAPPDSQATAKSTMPQSQPRLQTLPYLHRNWRAGVDSLETYAKMQLINGEDDHYSHSRLAKRPRYADSPDSGLGPDVDAFILHKDPVEAPNAMRIDVLKISHKDDESRAKQTTFLDANHAVIDKDIVTRARCKITVTAAAEVLYCDSQICTIRTLLNAAGVCRMARVYLPQPFLIPENKIFVQRPDDTTFDLADAYAVCVELQSTDGDNWPPLDLTNSKLEDNMPGAHTAPRHWSLAAEISNALNRSRSSGVLKLHQGLASVCRTNFVLNIDVRWTTSLPPKTTKTEQQHVYVSETANAGSFDDPAQLANGHSNGNQVNGHLPNGHLLLVEDDMEEDAEGELTPSRSLRARGSKNYNLKELSAKSTGRQPRKRPRITHLPNADSERVLYRLPRQFVTTRELIKGAFPCCVCHATHQSLAQLRAHLLGHALFIFEVIPTPGKQGHQIEVSCAGNKSGVYSREEVYSLGQPTKAFDLDKYVEGDESWVEDRLGPNNKPDKQEEKEVIDAVSRKTSQTKASRPVPVSYFMPCAC